MSLAPVRPALTAAPAAEDGLPGARRAGRAPYPPTIQAALGVRLERRLLQRPGDEKIVHGAHRPQSVSDLPVRDDRADPRAR
jgi:hypothetical protein